MEVQIPNGSVINNNGLFVCTVELWTSAVLFTLPIIFRYTSVYEALLRLGVVLLISMEWNKMAQELLQSDFIILYA